MLVSELLVLAPPAPEPEVKAVATALEKVQTVVSPHIAEKYSALVLSGEPKYDTTPLLAMKLS